MADQVIEIQGRSRRYKDMGDGTVAEVVSFNTGALALLWTNATLLGTNGSAASEWIAVAQYDVLRIGRTSAGGTYAFEVDWSRDGVTSDLTEVVAVGNNITVEKPVGAAFARFRARNTDAVSAFSAHRTNVYAR